MSRRYHAPRAHQTTRRASARPDRPRLLRARARVREDDADRDQEGARVVCSTSVEG